MWWKSLRLLSTLGSILIIARQGKVVGRGRVSGGVIVEFDQVLLLQGITVLYLSVRKYSVE